MGMCRAGAAPGRRGGRSAAAWLGSAVGAGVSSNLVLPLPLPLPLRPMAASRPLPRAANSAALRTACAVRTLRRSRKEAGECFEWRRRLLRREAEQLSNAHAPSAPHALAGSASDGRMDGCRCRCAHGMPLSCTPLQCQLARSTLLTVHLKTSACGPFRHAAPELSSKPHAAGDHSRQHAACSMQTRDGRHASVAAPLMLRCRRRP